MMNCTTLKTRALETTPRERTLRQAGFPGLGTGNGGQWPGFTFFFPHDGDYELKATIAVILGIVKK